MGILENLTNKFIKDNIKEYTSINESFDWVKKEDKLPLGGKFKPEDLENGKVLYEPNEGKITFTMSFDELVDGYFKNDYWVLIDLLTDSLDYSVFELDGYPIEHMNIIDFVGGDYHLLDDVSDRLDHDIQNYSFGDFVSHLRRRKDDTPKHYELLHSLIIELKEYATDSRKASLVRLKKYFESMLNQLGIKISRNTNKGSDDLSSVINNMISITVDYPYHGKANLTEVMEEIVFSLSDFEWDELLDEYEYEYNGDSGPLKKVLRDFADNYYK